MRLTNAHRPLDPQLLRFLEAYDPHVCDLALQVRQLVLEQAPDACEYVYSTSCVEIWFGFDAKVKDSWFCYITTHARHVNLGFVGGATLADPHGVLEGSGKQTRFIRFANHEDLARPFVRRFIQAAIAQAAPIETRGSGETVIKSASGKKRSKL